MEGDIFVLTNLPEVVKGALFSRYSRSPKSLRRVLLDEFIKDEKTGFREIVARSEGMGESQLVATKKAEDFYDRVLVGFGDDSVAELGGCHVACENVSNIASKALEDSRVGISPLEKSTRYVYFDEKVDGKYRYFADGEIKDSKHSDLYIKTCDSLFDSYSRLIPQATKWLTEKYTKGEESGRAYNSTIRAKACDILRGFLPASTLTNLGLFGNGRSFEYLLVKMYSHELKEIRDIAATMHAELGKVIPSFVKRARGEFGDPTIKFLEDTRKGMSSLAENLFKNEMPEACPEVALVGYDSNAEEKAISAALYPFTELPLGQVREKAAKMGPEQRAKVIGEYLGKRLNRRHKPGRGFEYVQYEFDVLMNYASFRDLHRHRMLTQQRQALTTRHGYDAPPELGEFGAQGEFAEKMLEADSAFKKISASHRAPAQYVVPFAYRIRWGVCLNLRELYHLVELRSTLQGHPDYRRVALKMLDEVKKVHPALVAGMRFANYSQAGLERLEAEKFTDRRLAELEKKKAQGDFESGKRQGI